MYLYMYVYIYIYMLYDNAMIVAMRVDHHNCKNTRRLCPF